VTSESINSKRVKEGAPILFMVSEDVLVGDSLAIPRGATVHGAVIKSRKAGRLTGSPELIFKLTSLELNGRSYPLYTYLFKMEGASKTRPTEAKVLSGAAVGAVFGGLTDGLANKSGVTDVGEAETKVMAITTGIGAGVGTAVAAASPGPGIFIPPEAQVDFYLAAPITVTKVSAKEAARLAEGLHSGGPSLYLRGETP
jgi:hypothetical protein